MDCPANLLHKIFSKNLPGCTVNRPANSSFAFRCSGKIIIVTIYSFCRTLFIEPFCEDWMLP